MTEPTSPRWPSLAGTKVVITGALGGIGLVCAQTLREHGATVLLSDLAAAETVTDRLAAGGFTVANYRVCDVRSVGDVARLFQDARTFFGAEPNVVCVHTGVVGSHPIDAYPVEEFDDLMAINTRGSFLTATEIARRWRAAGVPGNLIFTTSWVQDVPWPEIAPYAASKAAIKSLMRSFARELAPHGIRSNALAPGIVGVGMAKRQWDSDPAYRARAQRAIPLGDLQTPDSVADAMVFLASPLSSYMTGSTLLVDGGASLYPMD